MSTHNMCFSGQIRKKLLGGYPSYLELCILFHFKVGMQFSSLVLNSSCINLDGYPFTGGKL